MPRRVDFDRYLKRRGDSWSYHRRVPTALVNQDPRAPIICQALGTRDLAAARRARDVLEAADDQHWAAMMAGKRNSGADDRHAAAVKMALALGFGYRPTAELAETASWADLAERLETIMPTDTPPVVVDAALGLADAPRAKFSDALDVYCTEINRAELAKKSERQLKKWRVIPERAIRTFTGLVGNKELMDITRADAVKFYRHWLDKISPEDPTVAPMSASSGNRQIGELRKLYRAYFDHVHDDPDRPNPFRGLSFKEADGKKRPAFSDTWIAEKFLSGSALAQLNIEARAILWTMIETGARPSEICNLRAEHICLDGDIPHIEITEREDPLDPRQLKTSSSKRFVPLVGAALAAMKLFPKGFDRYRDKEEALSATINKFLTDNDLRETSKHSLYSIRHSFEDRMKRADFDVELRIALFGHASHRPVYGDAGGLAWKATKLQTIALNFDQCSLSPSSVVE